MRQWLKDSRIEKGLTMKELGAKLGISESYYSAIEAGTRQKNMDLTLVAALSSVLGISVADIVKYETDGSSLPTS
jgi:transcriptional regulator with XRE-family HTH domain